MLYSYGVTSNIRQSEESKRKNEPVRSRLFSGIIYKGKICPPVGAHGWCALYQRGVRPVTNVAPNDIIDLIDDHDRTLKSL
ncbi:MAG: hypothetical protein RID53_10505 [Coleofasciculus sp. B1-GNL1-01]|uniref:hypothetical protein n=1 Tax=Coleofasciculus sp. B1-GNL1-01 TaxID=3068484 RepID=UPI0032FE7684